MGVRIAVPAKGPVPTVEWFKDGIPVQPGDRLELVEIRDTGIYKLIVHDALPTDAGEYGIRVTNKAGSDQSKAPLEVEELVPPEFVVPLHDTSVIEEKTATLSVTVTGKPEPEIEWSKDGRPIQIDGDHFVAKKEDVGQHSLTVRTVANTDAGTYSCEAVNPAGRAETKASLAVVEDLQAPKFTKGLEPVEIKESESATLSVVAEGKPEPKIDWFKDGRPAQIDGDHVVRRDEGQGRHSITIKNALLEDAGIYSCKAVNKAGADETAAKFGVIEDVVPPRFTDGLKPMEVKEGYTASMSVTCTGKPEPSVEWFKDGRPIQMDRDNIVTKDEGNGRHSITINNARLEDAGTFSCKAVNKAGSDETAAKFGVIETLEPPKFTEGLTPTEVKEGEHAKMSVAATGKPEPDVEWFKDGRPIQIDRDHIVAKDEGHGRHSVTIENAALEDAGVFSCKAVNKAGSDETSANFGVIEDLQPPRFIDKLGEVEVEKGENVKLECTVVGKPEPDIRWLFNGQPIQIDNRHFIAKKDDKGHHTLIINDTNANDSGMYSCEAVNKAGRDETSGLLKFPKYEYESQPEEKVLPIEVESFEKTTAKEGDDDS
jgi:hypothetical protein